MADKKFDLGDYVEVKDRIKLFYELYAGGRLVTESVGIVEVGPASYVMVRALAYRTVDDPLPGVGTSWLAVPGSTSYTKGSEVENAETSAWGRAIGSLGILIDRSIASANEVRDNQRDPGNYDGPPARPQLERRADGLIGTVEVGKPPCDMERRETAEGGVIWGFKLKSGNKGYQAMATGQLADALSQVSTGLQGATVTVWGHIEMVPWEKDGKPMNPYARIAVERVQSPDWTLPADLEEALGVPEAESAELDSLGW